MTVYNKNIINYTKQPMFFGEALSVQRYDKFKYKVFDDLTEKQLSFFWRPQEVNLQKDISDFKSLTDDERFIFTENLKYQTLLDSVQGRAPSLVLLPYCSLPELEACINAWTFFEGIHSRSYTYIIKNLYPNPSIVFDNILKNDAISVRAKSITKYYDDFMALANIYFSGTYPVTEYELYKSFYLMLVVINALESLRFYVSFVCSFTFARNKKMEGSAKIISLISADESCHLSITQNIILNYKTHERNELMLQIIKDTTEEVNIIYRETVAQEKDWANHLFDGRAMLGLSAPMLHQYIEYMASKRMRAIGYESIFDKVEKNPFEHLNSFFDSKSLQVSPQETQLQSYLVGAVNNDVSDTTFEGFEL